MTRRADISVGDQVLDADGELWTVLNRPHADISSAEPCNGLFLRERSPQGQRYGEHMHGPLVVWETAAAEGAP